MITTEYATCQACGQRSNWIHDDGACPWCKKPRNAPAVAPLAAQPSETKSCGFPFGEMKCDKSDGHDGGHSVTTPWIRLGKPAPQPAPAKVACPYANVSGERHIACDGAGVQRWRGKYLVSMCDAHYLNFEAIVNTDDLTNVLDNPSIPERIERPKLAHIAGMHDDDLIGGAR